MEGCDVGEIDYTNLLDIHREKLYVTGVPKKDYPAVAIDCHESVPAELSTKESSTHEPETKAWFPLDSIQSEPTAPPYFEITGLLTGIYSKDPTGRNASVAPFYLSCSVNYSISVGNELTDEYENTYRVVSVTLESLRHLYVQLDFVRKSEMFARLLVDFKHHLTDKMITRMAILSKKC